MRCVVPGMLPQMNIRTPLQTRLVGSRGCLISSTPTQIRQSTPILSTVMPPKVFQQQAVIATSSSTTHLNGIQGEEQMEVCTPAVESKISGEVIHTPVIQALPAQNHVANDSSPKDNLSSDLNSLQCFEDKVVNNESDQNFILSQIQGNTVTYRLAGPNEVPISGNRLFVQSKPSGDRLSLPREPNGTSVFANTKPGSTCLSLPVIQPKINSISPAITKPVYGVSEEQTGDQTPIPQVRKVEICKKSPLLNGLLDKGKPPLSGDILFNALVENGIEASDVGLELPKSPSPVQTPIQPKLIPVSPALNSIVLPASSLNSVLIPASSLTSGILPLSSSSNSVITSYVLTSPTSVTPHSAVSLNSNGANVVQIRTGKTTFSGTAEVQPDQKGVVRLHIESPENSNQGSDLSSISDIARTLECASEAISKTNAECNTQVPQTCTMTSTATVICTNNAATLGRPNQQIIVMTPTLNQQQLQLQSPNIKFCILHTMPMAEEGGMDLVGVPQINLSQLNQLQQQQQLAPSDSPLVSSLNLKRPSSDTSPMCIVTNVKKPRVEPQTLQLSTGVITSAPSMDVKSPEVFPKAVTMENLKLVPKVSSVKAVPVQNADLPSEQREVKTLSGLLSSGGNNMAAVTAAAATSSVTSSKGSSKPEYMCEWKNCGLKFPNPGSVFLHASKIHTPPCDGDMICQWEGCDSMKRRQFSLLTHLQDWHCNERVLHVQAMRRMQIGQQGQTSLAPPQKPPPHPGYAPDAAVLAIKRHALQYVNPKELSEEKESALTKSIRLTSALILRNLVTHSALARTYTRRFEAELAYLAMSPVESAKAIAQCLAHLSRSND